MMPVLYKFKESSWIVQEEVSPSKEGVGYRVRYYTLARLLDEVRLARFEGKEVKFFEKMEHLGLLIIDDFGMKKLEGQQ